MKIAVIEVRLTSDALSDARALAAEARIAARAGAEAVFLPAVVNPDEPRAAALLGETLRSMPDVLFVPDLGSPEGGRSRGISLSQRLGELVMLIGDECLDASVLQAAAAEGTSVLVLSPRSESELQAEAFLEFAVRLSEAISGLVIVAEAVGALPGDPGHGGSAIILLGEVLAESVDSDGGILTAQVPEPIPAPSSRPPMPELPTLLAQRKAQHAGRKMDMGYLAELT